MADPFRAVRESIAWHLIQWRGPWQQRRTRLAQTLAWEMFGTAAARRVDGRVPSCQGDDCYGQGADVTAEDYHDGQPCDCYPPRPPELRPCEEYAARAGQEVCAWCGRAIALAERPTLDGQEWFCSDECDDACTDQEASRCSCGKPFPEDGGAEGVCECCSGCSTQDGCSDACQGTWPAEPGQPQRPFHVSRCPNRSSVTEWYL